MTSEAAAAVSPDDVTIEDLAYAFPGAWASYCSGYRWYYGPHLKMIEDQLLRIHEEPLRLIISAPPRSGKSEFMSQYFPSWFLGRFPHLQVMLLTYQGKYSEKWSKKVRNALRMHGPSVFDVSVSDDSRSGASWQTDQNGGMEAVGAGGALTGKGSNLLIVDDLVKGREEALSSGTLDDRWEFWGSDVYSRVEPSGHIIVIATRWSEYDLSGRLIEQMRWGKGDDWTVLNFPALIESEEDARIDPLGREVGEALWPERGHDREFYQKRKENMLPFWWLSLYQGRPVPREGNMVNIEWLRYYHELPEDYEFKIIVYDTAQKENELNDFTVIGIWRVKNGRGYLEDLHRERLTHPNLMRMAGDLESLHKPNLHLVEDKGSGTSLIQHMEDDGNFNYLADDPVKSKVMRFDAESEALRSGRLLLPYPEEKPWVEDYVEELRVFPNGLHDDQADMTSLFLKWLRERSDRSPFDVF